MSCSNFDRKRKPNKCQKVLGKDLTVPCIEMNIKQKVRLKTRPTNVDIFCRE